MISKKTELTLIVTIFAIFLTMLTFVWPKYASLWLALEVIIIEKFGLKSEVHENRRFSVPKGKLSFRVLNPELFNSNNSPSGELLLSPHFI